MFHEGTPEQVEARKKWVDAVCESMAKRFSMPLDGSAMAMIRMMAEVSSYNLFCPCGKFHPTVCDDCLIGRTEKK